MNDKKENQNVLDLKPVQRQGGRLPHSKIAQFTPDEDLIQSTSRIKNQRDTVLDRIEKMQTSENRVSHSVFEKVKRDYSLQLDTINELLDEKKQILKDEIRKLYMIREKLTVEVNRHREILEEADFRHFLGEFTQTQYQEVENFETKEIEKAESDLSHINQWIKAHEELFDPQDFGQKPAPQAKTPQTAPNSDVTQTAYKNPASAPVPAPVSTPQPTVPAQNQSHVVAPQPTAQNTDQNYDHLFSETSSHDQNSLKHPSNTHGEDVLPNLDDLIDEVQSTTGEIDFLADNAPEIKVLSDTTATPENKDYFASQNVHESSFNIPQPQTNMGESVTLARQSIEANHAVAQHNKPEQDVKKDDSISDILESIRLEGEDDVASTNSDLKTTQIVTDYKLKLVEGDLDIKDYPMKANTSIGRSPSNDVVLKEPKVSRQHAAINLYNDNYILVDLKSSNGVFVNGTKVDETVLHAGDEISIGGYKFIFMKNNA